MKGFKAERLTGESIRYEVTRPGYYHEPGDYKYVRGTRFYLCEHHPTKKEPNRKKLSIVIRKFFRQTEVATGKITNEYEQDVRSIPIDEGMVDSLLDALILAQSYLRGNVKDLV